MSGPKNGVLSDPLPYQLPEVQGASAPKPVPKSDWEKLRGAKSYKQINDYIEVRKEYYRHFLPGGEALRDLVVKDPTLAGQWAGFASTIVDELDQLQYKINTVKVK